jgi:hypothetical protein
MPGRATGVISDAPNYRCAELPISAARKDLWPVDVQRDDDDQRRHPHVHRVECEWLVIADVVGDEPDDEPDESQRYASTVWDLQSVSRA